MGSGRVFLPDILVIEGPCLVFWQPQVSSHLIVRQILRFFRVQITSGFTNLGSRKTLHQHGHHLGLKVPHKLRGGHEILESDLLQTWSSSTTSCLLPTRRFSPKLWEKTALENKPEVITYFREKIQTSQSPWARLPPGFFPTLSGWNRVQWRTSPWSMENKGYTLCKRS